MRRSDYSHKAATQRRERFVADGRWIRECRVRYFLACRTAVEANPELIRVVAKRAVDRGLLGKTLCHRNARYSILRTWWRADEGSHSWSARCHGYDWHSWLRQWGWLSYQWLHETDARAVKVRMAS